MPSAPISFYERVDSGLQNDVMRGALSAAAQRFSTLRSNALAIWPDADLMRDAGRLMRRHTIANLERYLEQFAGEVERQGGVVHWATDAAEANRIVAEIGLANRVKRVVKSKSMLTEEIHLNQALEQAGMQVVETDLGEYIAQIEGEKPSHIIAPILHKTRQEVGRVLERALHVPYSEDPRELAGIARNALREIFLQADMGITGANFGVAETGTIALVTNEGNEGMCTALPRVHVALIGIERIVPNTDDLALILQLLARSATGQKLSVYTSFITGPRRRNDLDGPEQLHVVLVDNGRSAILQSELAEILTCIRCGACLNACPVYKSIGGHAYGSIYPGPIGSVLSPLLFGLEQYGDLAHASSLCGACMEVCPVRIDLPTLLLKVREQTVDQRQAPWWLSIGLNGFAFVMRRPWMYRLGAKLASIASHLLGRNGWIRRLPPPLNAWTSGRDFPSFATKSFQERWAEQASGKRKE